MDRRAVEGERGVKDRRLPAVIEDRGLRVPIPARAFVDRELADDTAARALLASRNRVIMAARRRREEEEAGELRALAESVLIVLDVRGVAVSDAQREAVRARRDRATLEWWQRAAVTAASTDDALR